MRHWKSENFLAKFHRPLLFYLHDSPSNKGPVCDYHDCNLKMFHDFTPKISAVIFLTVCDTILTVLVWRIRYQIN